MQTHYEKYGRKCYFKNKDKYSPVRKKWAQEHRAQCVKRVQAYVQRNKRKVADYNAQFQQTVMGSFRTYKYSAKRRGCKFVLSFQDFSDITSQCCKYCGNHDSRIGIDRTDNTIGYTKDNSAPCCKLCNFMKKAMTVTDFLTHIKKIYDKNR